MAGECEQMASRAPSVAKASAAARPSPREAPVTNVTRSFKPRSIETSCVGKPGDLCRAAAGRQEKGGAMGASGPAARGLGLVEARAARPQARHQIRIRERLAQADVGGGPPQPLDP